uniref:Uncharacterized protein n=1 Tax=Physcomitrium patens TaxID=3218 RepID=A0A2K1INH8_PHYPA|nr:hypothetical protein PHYPA_027140 [Physcomitrium patens]
MYQLIYFKAAHNLCISPTSFHTNNLPILTATNTFLFFSFFYKIMYASYLFFVYHFSPFSWHFLSSCHLILFIVSTMINC